jgi:dockerin type I repeat protein
MNDRPENHEQEPPAPARLVEGLRSLHNQKPLVPPFVDEAILAHVHARLKGQSERARVVWLPRWAMAAAAVIVLCIGAGLLLTRRTNPPAIIAREDIDRNGQVNILDAFALARKLQQGGGDGTVLDLNGDGVVDQRDIDWVASRAVKLHKG